MLQLVSKDCNHWILQHKTPQGTTHPHLQKNKVVFVLCHNAFAHLNLKLTITIHYDMLVNVVLLVIIVHRHYTKTQHP
jgi:hypothetical protein